MTFWKRILLSGAAAVGLLVLVTGCTEYQSEDGLRYFLSEGGAIVTQTPAEAEIVVIPDEVGGSPVTDLAVGAVRAETAVLSLPDGVDFTRDMTGEETALRGLLLGQDAEATGLPAGCRVYRRGQDIGCGTLTGLTMDEQGVLYGVTDTGTGAVLSIPATVTDFLVLPEWMDSTGAACRVDYLAAGALEGADGLQSLTLGEEMSFAPELLEQLLSLKEFSYPDFSLTADYVLSLQAAAQINEQRAANGLEALDVDLGLIRAARTRMAELGELYAFDRPDGRSGYTAIEEAGIDYHFATAYNHFGTDFDAMCSSMIEHLAAEESDAEAAVIYEHIGFSAGLGGGDEERPYVSTALFTNSTQAEVVYGNVTYALQEEMLVPVSCESSVHWFYLAGELWGREVGPPADTLFASCPDLCAVLLLEGYPYGDAVPSEYAVIRQGEDTGDGAAELVYVTPEGEVYVRTDRDRYVFWSMPKETQTAYIRYSIGNIPVTYLRTEALDGCTRLENILLPDGCCFEPDDLDVIDRYNVYPYNAENETITDDVELLSSSYVSLLLTDRLAKAVNELRTGDRPVMHSSCGLVQAARTLAREQEQQFGTTRPDGESWTTVFAQQYVDWDQGRISLKKFDTLTQAQAFVQEVAETFAPVQEKGHTFTQAAIGTYATDNALYVCALAITE